MDRQKLLTKLEKAWAAFKESYAGLSDSQLTEPGVTGNWSVKDIIAHVTWWDEEALKHLPLIIKGGRAPRYSATYGGIDAFNALMTEQKRSLSLADVLRHQDETHRRLVTYIHSVSEEQFASDTRVRRRLRLDTLAITLNMPRQYSHGEAVRVSRVTSGEPAEVEFSTSAQENPAASETFPQTKARRKAQAGSESGHTRDLIWLPGSVREGLLCALPPVLLPTTGGRCHRLSTLPFRAALQIQS